MTQETKPTTKELFAKATESLLDEIDSLELKAAELSKELVATTKLLDLAEGKLDQIKEILK